MKNSLLLYSILLLVSCGKNGETTEKKDDRVPVRAEKVRHQSVQIPVRTSGVIAQKKEMKLSFKVGGILKTIFVNEGEQVHKGQQIATLDQTEIDSRVKQAELAYNKAVRDFDRVARLKNENVATKEQFENAKTMREVSASDLKIARYNQMHSVIKAPSEGRILKTLVEENEMLGPGHPVIIFASSASQTIVRAHLTDTDILRVSLNDNALILFDSYKNSKFNAVVSEVAAAANQQTGTYEIELAMDTNSKRFLTGMMGKIELYPSETQEMLVVTVDALFKANGTSGEVFVLDKSHQYVKKVSIELGPVIGNVVTVKSGLSLSDEVIVEGVSYLTDHAKINLVSEPTISQMIK